jgi:hypothetical protein
VERYGHCVTMMLDGGMAQNWRSASRWWKDMVNLENFGAQGWFNMELTRIIGNGRNSSFWHIKWRGDTTFRSKYPRLYSISNQKDSLVGELGEVVGSSTVWHFAWRRDFFDWEEQLFANLMLDLEGMSLSHEEDRWKWGLEDSGFFSVKSAYGKLEGMVLREDLWSVPEKRVFRKIWKSPALSRVVALSWKLLYDRIPTKVNLAVRNVLPMEASRLCALCERVDESSTHLFLHCDIAGRVWQGIMRWWERFLLIPPNLFVLWECWSEGERNKIIRKGLRLIWHATVWVLWIARNNSVFNSRITEVDEIVDDIKVLSWRWSLYRISIPMCMYYEWCWCPRECILRLV